MPTALIIKTNGETEPLILGERDSEGEQSNYLAIKQSVGGILDTVYNDGDSVVCYVHDEGLLIGLPVNAFATMLFGRPLVGDVVLVGCLNEFGENDGYDYELPGVCLSDEFIKAAKAVNSNEQLVAILTQHIAEMDFSPKVISMTDNDFSRWCETGEIPTDDTNKGDN
jgi:hypothetical protein